MSQYFSDFNLSWDCREYLYVISEGCVQNPVVVKTRVKHDPEHVLIHSNSDNRRSWAVTAAIRDAIQTRYTRETVYTIIGNVCLMMVNVISVVLKF